MLSECCARRCLTAVFNDTVDNNTVDLSIQRKVLLCAVLIVVFLLKKPGTCFCLGVVMCACVCVRVRPMGY